MKKSIEKTGRLLLAMTLTLGVAFGAQAAEADKSKEGDFVRGARAWAENCTRCHNVRDPKELRDDQWKTTVFHMRVRGGLTGQQTRDIIKFMQESN